MECLNTIYCLLLEPECVNVMSKYCKHSLAVRLPSREFFSSSGFRDSLFNVSALLISSGAPVLDINVSYSFCATFRSGCMSSGFALEPLLGFHLILVGVFQYDVHHHRCKDPDIWRTECGSMWIQIINCHGFLT